VTKVAERLLQQTLGEARYKELLEQSKSNRRKKRKARDQATGSHVGKKPKESDAWSSLSPSTTTSPTKTSTNTERVNDDGDDDDVIEWEGPTSDDSNYFSQQQPETASSAKPELDAQVIEILRALGIDVDVYEPLLSRTRAWVLNMFWCRCVRHRCVSLCVVWCSYASLPKGIQVEIMSNARGLEKHLSTSAAPSHTEAISLTPLPLSKFQFRFRFQFHFRLLCCVRLSWSFP
jgi:hypothetical protein